MTNKKQESYTEEATTTMPAHISIYWDKECESGYVYLNETNYDSITIPWKEREGALNQIKNLVQKYGEYWAIEVPDSWHFYPLD